MRVVVMMPGGLDVLLETGQSRLRPGDVAGLQGAADGLKILADAAAAIEQARAAGGLRGGLDLLLQGGISTLRAGQITRLQGAGQSLEILRLLLDGTAGLGRAGIAGRNITAGTAHGVHATGRIPTGRQTGNIHAFISAMNRTALETF